jgi:hypothetical protein
MNNSAKAFRLPPLILHPFSSPEDTSVLMESSRASLALQGFLPRDETPAQDLDRQLLRGRYAELRMLYYIGKDVSRWTEQCAETVLALPEFNGRHAIFQEIPKVEDFSPEFLRRYHRYLDQWYEQRLRDWVFERPKAEDYMFDLYASGEYAMMLEQSWNAGEGKST